MNIGIIDAELVGRKKHRFPNLVCEKISGYHKLQGDNVILKTDYENLGQFDKVFVSKVFTDTPFDMNLLSDKVVGGGTGFYFDKAIDLPNEIEHCMPDYHLYDDWIKIQDDTYKQFNQYEDYSIRFLTRGCFRKCGFCVNQKYDKVSSHSPLREFYDESRKKICLLDDNFFGYRDWKYLLQELKDINKPFKFNQGLDERLLTPEKCEMLFSSKYDGDIIFAFDNIIDYNLIHDKIKMIREYTDNTRVKFYVLCGYESTDATDIINTFKRIELLMKYRCLPYIMRYQSTSEIPWRYSKYQYLYVAIARWCNQPNFFKKKSFREFCEFTQSFNKKKLCTAMQAMYDFEKEFPREAEKYFDMKFEDFCK